MGEVVFKFTENLLRMTFLLFVEDTSHYTVQVEELLNILQNDMTCKNIGLLN